MLFPAKRTNPVLAGIRTFRQRTFRQPTLRQRTFRQRTFRQRTFRQNRQGGHFANLIFFSSKLRSYYHKPHDNDSTKVLYNKISNTLVLCRCISLESSCTTYIWTMPPYLLRVASIVLHWLNLFIGSPLGSNRLALCRCITLESSSECLARLG